MSYLSYHLYVKMLSKYFSMWWPMSCWATGGICSNIQPCFVSWKIPPLHTHAIVSYCPITGLGEMNPFKYLARYGSVSSDPTALLDC